MSRREGESSGFTVFVWVFHEFGFDVMLRSTLGYKNSDGGHIKCLRGPHLARVRQISHPCAKLTILRPKFRLSCP